ncbi:hypothetical protein [Bradyrhizobium sp. ORS 111]|uniref:hypothetical protein n=1 Tax=Bradyrhizobium sp. ORS 111 TaxID=1685958 RepID=UPI003890BAF8
MVIQNGGTFPAVTLQSTITQSTPNGPLTTTSFNNILEFDYALDPVETEGLLAGFQDTRTDWGVRCGGSVGTRFPMSAATIDGPTTGNSLAAWACNRSKERSF